MTNQTATKITVRYSSVDGCHETRSFRTLAGARRFAHLCVGTDADVGRSYAASSDGVGMVTVNGTSLDELFSGKTRTFDDLSDAEQDAEIAFAEKQERLAEQWQIEDAINTAESATSVEDWAMREYDRS